MYHTDHRHYVLDLIGLQIAYKVYFCTFIEVWIFFFKLLYLIFAYKVEPFGYCLVYNLYGYCLVAAKSLALLPQGDSASAFLILFNISG